MEITEQMDIRLVVSDEQTLYNPFNPEVEFGRDVKSYIQSKAATGDPGQSISLTVISREALDEDRFRAAVANWITEERALFACFQMIMICLYLRWVYAVPVMIEEDEVSFAAACRKSAAMTRGKNLI